jgi:valyl-tRNA synthetase
MEVKTLENLLNKPFDDIKPYYIGVFVKGKAIVSKYIKKSEKLEGYFSRMVERSLEINDAIKNFNAEFLFSGGKDFSIMIYYTTAEIAIGIIHIGKPNFPLLKITAQDLARELKKYEKDLLLYYEEYLKPVEEQVKSEKKENYQINSDELEKVLSDKIEESIQQKEDIPKNTLKSTENASQTSKSQKDNIIENKPPSLEEILSKESNIEEESVIPSINEILELNRSEEDLSNINIILNEIEKEFIKIIGPFGKYIFKKRKEEFFQKGNITKFSVLKFIHSLAEEIPEFRKRDLFIENTKNFLLNF